MPPPSSKNREDATVRRQLPTSTISIASINFAHGTAASGWPALYHRWTTVTSDDDMFWVARFEEVKTRKLSLKIPYPLLKLDALVVSCLLDSEHSQQIVDSKLVVPLVEVMRLLCKHNDEEAAALCTELFDLVCRSSLVDAAMHQIVPHAEHAAANHNLDLLHFLVELPVSNRRAFKAALLTSSVPSSLESFWDRNKGATVPKFWKIIVAMCFDSPNPRRLISILSEALDIGRHQFRALQAIVYSSLPRDDELLPKILRAFKERFTIPSLHVFSFLHDLLLMHFDTIQVLDNNFVPTVIPRIIPWIELEEILGALIAIVERATPIILHQVMAAGGLSQLSSLLQDTNCDEEVRELAVRCQQLLLQTPIEHDKPNRPEDRTVGFSLQQQQHDFIL